MEGLADGAAPGCPPRITEEVRAFLDEKLSEEERTWNATQLAEAVQERFGVRVTPETIRQHLLAMGYRWKRTRYVPSRPPDPEEERKARADLEELKLKGAEEGEHVLKYPDESGFAGSLCACRPRRAGPRKGESTSVG